MVQEQGSIRIDRPVEDVFNFLLDGMNNPLWRTSVLDSQKVAGKANTYKQGMKGPTGRMDGDYEVTDIRPNELIAMRAIAGMARPTSTYELAAEGEVTQVTFTMKFEGKGPAKLMEPLAATVMRGEIAMLPNLKACLERAAESQSPLADMPSAAVVSAPDAAMTQLPMSAATNPQAPYVRHISPSGGRFARWKINLILRLAVKNSYHYDFDVAAHRQSQAALDPKLSTPDPAVRRSSVDCDGVAAQWVEAPESRSAKVILYLHGGAWFMSFPNLHHNMVARLCRMSATRSLVIDYRLAPEHRFPSGFDDCWTSWRWLLTQGIAASDIVIAGDSAGGNLTLALLHCIKAEGDPLPACALLLSPLVDMTLSSPSLVINEKTDHMFTHARMIGLRHLYLDADQMLDPRASPLFADFHGLPPLLFQSSASEALRDESLRAAARAFASDVPVEVELWEGLPHVFQSMSALPQSQLAIENMADFIRRHSGWSEVQSNQGR